MTLVKAIIPVIMQELTLVHRLKTEIEIMVVWMRVYSQGGCKE